MATYQELAEQNPTIRRQYDQQRSQSGENPTDYRAFRQHPTSIGAPAPGEQAIDDFVGGQLQGCAPGAVLSLIVGM